MFWKGAAFAPVVSAEPEGLTSPQQTLRWLRGHDLNMRPLGYEPNELPGCSTPPLYSSVVELTDQRFRQFCFNKISNYSVNQLLANFSAFPFKFNGTRFNSSPSTK